MGRLILFVSLFLLSACDFSVNHLPPEDVTVTHGYEISISGGYVELGGDFPDDGDVEDEERKEEEDVPVDPLVVPQLSLLKYFVSDVGYGCCVGAVQIPYTDEWQVLHGYPLRDLQELKVTLINVKDERSQELKEVKIVKKDFAANVPNGWSKSWDDGFEQGPYLDILYKEENGSWQQIKQKIDAGWQTIQITD